MKLLIVGFVLAFATAGCKPSALSKKGTERACDQICSNSVLRLTRIKEIQHKPGSTNAVVVYEHLKEDGLSEERLLFLVYNQSWDIDSAKQAKYAHQAWTRDHP